MTSFNSQISTTDHSFYPHARPELLEPLMMELPVPPVEPPIQMPRSAKRAYSASELSAAALMLNKLRSRADVIDQVRKQTMPTANGPDEAIDRVVERLLSEI